MKIPGEVLGRTGGRLMRADRLLSILLLLQVHRRITAGELAKRLEVSERTIHRDMEALSGAGVPVTAGRSPAIPADPSGGGLAGAQTASHLPAGRRHFCRAAG